MDIPQSMVVPGQRQVLQLAHCHSLLIGSRYSCSLGNSSCHMLLMLLRWLLLLALLTVLRDVGGRVPLDLGPVGLGVVVVVVLPQVVEELLLVLKQ